MKTPIFKAAIISYLNIFLNVISGIFLTPWIILQLGISTYGIYTLGLSVIAFFSMDFGVGSSVSKFLLDYKLSGDEAGQKNIINIFFRIFMFLSLIIALIMFVFYYFIDITFSNLSAIEIIKFKYVYIIAALFAIVSMIFRPFDGILVANEKFVFIKFCDFVCKLILVISIFLLLKSGFNLYSLVIANVVTGLFRIGLNLYYITNKNLAKICCKVNDFSVLKKIFIFSSWVAISLIAQRFILLITPFVLASTVNAKEVSIFSIAMVIEGYFWLILSVIGSLILPKVAKIINNSTHSELNDFAIGIGRIQLFISGLFVLIFSLVGKDFIIFWVGTDFIKSYFVICLLIIPGLFVLPFTVFKTALIVSGKVKYQAYSLIFTAAISLTFSVLLSPRFGAIGSGIGIGVGTFIGNFLILSFFYIKECNLNILKFLLECYFPYIKFLLLLLFIFYIKFAFIRFNDQIIDFIFNSSFIFTTYIVFGYYYFLNSNEKHKVKLLLNIMR